MILRFRSTFGLCCVVVVITAKMATLTPAQAQTTTAQAPASARFVDQTNGMTADEAAAYALAHNGELQAARKEIDAARAMVKQARLRANPMLEVEGTRQVNGKDNSVMASAMLQLELGGRRTASIKVAE